jgi:predicted nuclease of predicted toxin-antitoxin system
VKYYFDEDSAQHRLVAALRSHGIDVATSLDSGMNARDDESQLILASAQNRVLVSANARDFASLHRAWLERGKSHSGILIIPQQRYSTGETVRRILRLASSKFDLASGIYYLSNF